MKYRLKKWYPSLDRCIKVGDIAKKNGCHQKQYLVNSRYFVDTCEVENNPEFWEKVKDYEILVVKGKQCNHNLHSNMFHSYIKAGHPIVSVKRLSDGEVFTVGDKIYCCGSTGVIEQFVMVDNRIRLDTDCAGKPFLADFIKHHRKPLFTTHDGVGIYEGDYVWVPQKSSFNGKHSFDGNVTRFKVVKPQHHYIREIEEGVKYFSTKEKAQEYADYNKLQYSMKDIEELLDDNEYAGRCKVIYKYDFLEALKLLKE